MTQPIDVEVIPPMLAQRGPRVQAPAAYLARLSPGSRRAQWQAIRLLSGRLWLVGSPLDAPWAELTPDRVTLVQAWLRTRYSPTTVRRVMSALRGIVSELWRQEAITAEQRDRLLDIAVTRGSSPPAGRALSLAEIQSLYAVADARDKALLAGLLWGGMRRSELVTAKESSRTLKAVQLTVLGKGGKVRHVWIHGQPARDYGPTGLTSSGMWKVLDKLAKRAGVRHFSPHDLRRTYASLSLAQGVDLALVQRAMGHADPRTTARYDRRPDEAQAEAARGLADIAAKVYDGGQS